ncbi:histidine kinase [Flavobacteriales bacterium 34_180_T64]|nr:histidine kinase [Flavobacteriales bacterium 34_180_T64]
MEEPNLSYIHSLSGGDKVFEEKILSVIKLEFPLEKAVYYKNLENKNYMKAAENVHKLKHKISILGLERSYEIAIQYENNLKANNSSLKTEFNTVLQIITNYLNTL